MIGVGLICAAAALAGLLWFKIVIPLGRVLELAGDLDDRGDASWLAECPDTDGHAPGSGDLHPP